MCTCSKHWNLLENKSGSIVINGKFKMYIVIVCEMEDMLSGESTKWDKDMTADQRQMKSKCSDNLNDFTDLETRKPHVY